MAAIFKRFSRSRSNSRSYVDNYNSPHDSRANSHDYDEGRYDKYSNDRYANEPLSAGGDAQYDDRLDDRRELPSSRQSNNAPPFTSSSGQETSVDNMYPRQSQPTEVPNSYGSSGALRTTNGYVSREPNGYDGSRPQQKESSAAPTDLLMQAFNQALRPHQDKIDGLESEIADLRAYIGELEQQRGDVHAWIDKRGLRPGNFNLTPHRTSQLSH